MASPPSSTAFIFSSSSYSYSSPHFHPLHYLHPIPIPIGSSTLLPINHQTHYSSCPKPPLPVVVVRRRIACKGSSSSSEQTSTTSTTSISRAVDSDSDEEMKRKKRWVPVVPLAALPKGERRVIIQDGETILLLWYKDQVVAIENRSPAQGAFTEGLLNAKLTQDGRIVCPTTDTTYDLQTGAVKDWYPNNPVLRFLTPSLRSLLVYPVKTDDNNIYISMGQEGFGSGVSAEIVFSGTAQPGVTASDVNIEEVRMVVDEDSGGFGFTPKNELINGKAAIIGFLLLLDFEALTGKGLLKGTGFLDFLYATSNAINSL